MESVVMTPEIGITLGVMGVAVILFITNAVRVDVVGFIMIVALPLLKILEPKEAISGFSSNAVISIIAVIIIGAALDKTGVMNILAKQIMRLAGKKESTIIATIAGTAAFVSGFMQNVGVAALFMPTTFRISRKLNFPASKALMPMGFCAIIGGCLTLIGCSPLILLNDLMEKWYMHDGLQAAASKMEFQPLGLFSVTPMGVALVISSILYFLLLGKYILPKSENESDSAFISEDLIGTYGKYVGKVFELVIPPEFEAKRLEELKIRAKYLSFVVGISRDNGKKMITAPLWEDILQPNDVIAVISNPERIEKMAQDLNLTIKYDLEVFADQLSIDNAGIMEAIIPPRSKLVGKSLRQLGLRKNYGINPLALYRDGELILEGVSNVTIKSGDAILMQGSWKMFHIMKETSDFIFSQEIKGEIMEEGKAKLAVAGLVLALTLALAFKIQLPISLMSGALFMILTKVLTVDEAYKSVDWMTVFLLSGLIPLGIAFQKTGTANFIASSIMGMIGNVSPLVLLGVIAALTSFFTLVTSNVGATVLLVPLSMNMAVKAGIDPKLAAMTVGIAASNTFVLPTHQVNALIMGPGGYVPLDYVKAGGGMTIIYLLVMILMLGLFYM